MKIQDLTRGEYRKVFLFDLDSTITREELLPRIAKLNNTFDELKSLTREAMLNGSDFESSFRERVSILAQIPLSEVQECVRTVPLLEELMGWIQQNLKNTFIVTGNLDIWIEALLNSYSLKSFSSTARVVDSRVHINETLDKEKVIEAFTDDFIVYVGDGSNDIGIMELSNIGILTEIVHESPGGLWEVADYAVKDERTLCNLLKRL